MTRGGLKLKRMSGEFDRVRFSVASPFASWSQALLFCLVVGAVLAWPYLNTFYLHASASDVYRSIPPRFENYRFMGDQIAAGGDVDVLFVGGSDAQAVFDAPFIQEALTKRLGRPARVLNFSTQSYGAEAQYAFVKDALSRLRVKVV